MKIINLIIMTAISISGFCNLQQQDLQKIVLNIQTAQDNHEENACHFEHFLPPKNRVFLNLDFNIKNVTTIASNDPIKQPGLAPDWGTKIFESMHFENLTFQGCNFKWINFSNSHFKKIKFIKCNFEWTVFDEASFQDVVFEDCNLIDSSFCKSKLDKVFFYRNNASFVNFMETSFQNVTYVSNNLQGSNFFKNTANCFSLQGENENVLLYDLKTNINKPVVLISWNNKKPTIGAVKIVKKIEALGGIPFKVNYSDPDIDCAKLENEINAILKQIDTDSSESLPKKIFEIAKKGNFPEISKIQRKAHDWMWCVSGVIIPGGQDIQPFFYGQKPHPKTFLTQDLRRDLFEFAILDEIAAKDIPLLGICRGMQVVNVWHGGSLKQHVEGHLFEVQKYHFVKKFMNSTLTDIFSVEESFLGYSFHHQAVDKVGKGLNVIATSADGTIKALDLPEKRFGVLVQWHPEFKGDVSSSEAAQLDAKLSLGNHVLYERFIAAAREKVTLKSESKQ